MRERTHAERALELQRLLDTVAKHCATKFGSDILRSLHPSFDRQVVLKRLTRTQEALQLLAAGDQPSYANARDVQSEVTVAAKGSTLPEETLFRVSETLGAFFRVRKWVESGETKELRVLSMQIPVLLELAKNIEQTIAPSGEVLDGASATLASIRSKKAVQQKRILDRVQSLVNSLKSYLQEPIFTERSGRYVLPVKAAYKGKVPGIVHDSSGSGQTLYIEPENVLQETNKLRELDGAEKEEIDRILLELSGKVGAHSHEICAGIEALGEIDAVVGCGLEAEKTGGVLPRLVNDAMLSISKGHHPLLDRESSVPLDVTVGGSAGSLLITGPNTGGKTVCLKVLGLYALMIGCGILPPAREIIYGPFTAIFADIGDEQSLQQSLSTFSGHVKNLSRALKMASAGALCLFDEIGAGTDPAEGAAIGKAILSSLAEKGAVIAATTHYGELKEFAIESSDFRTAAMEFDLTTLKPTYKLIEGATGASHAFEIAKRYGLPESVARTAEQLLSDQARTDRGKAEKLDALIAEATSKREQAEELMRENAKELAKLKAERENVKQKLERVRESAQAELSEAIREMRAKYRALLASTASLAGQTREKVLEQAREVEEQFVEASHALEQSPENAQGISEGDVVRVRGRAQTAVVLELQKTKAVVQMGALRFSVDPKDLELAQHKESKPRRSSTSHHQSAATTVSSELMLRRLRVDEAMASLQEYFDTAALANLQRARIVHGKGDGVLRKVVRDFLAKRSDVSRFYEAASAEGGAGVTIVEFK